MNQQSILNTENLVTHQGQLQVNFSKYHLRHLTLLSDTCVKPHRHKQLVHFFAIFNGCVEFNLDGCIYQITKPSVVYVPALCVHSRKCFQNSKTLLLTTTRDIVASTLDAYRNESFSMAKHLCFEANLNMPAKFFFSTGVANSWELGCMDVIFRILLLECVQARDTSLPQRTENSHGRQCVELFQSMVDKQFNLTHNLEDYCREIGVSPSKLYRYCREILHQPPKQVIHDRLALEAKRLLIYTGNSINSIAYELGFADSCYFSRFFRRKFKLTPSEFRKQK